MRRKGCKKTWPNLFACVDAHVGSPFTTALRLVALGSLYPQGAREDVM